MRLITAIKVFIKALKEPQWARDFLAGKQSSDHLKKQEELEHLRFLGLLQRSGRFIDFLKEDIGPYSDQQVGAVVRRVHQQCGESLEEVVTIRPLFTEDEGSEVVIPKGYDPAEVKIVGQVKQEGPYKGKIVHRGWRAHKRTLPKQAGQGDPSVLCPAEIEVLP